MTINRYKYSAVIDNGAAIGTSSALEKIRSAIISGVLQYREVLLKERERLDVLAGVIYDDSRLWWILAAASDIGWGLQVPAGTVIRIPDLVAVNRLLG